MITFQWIIFVSFQNSKIPVIQLLFVKIARFNLMIIILKILVINFVFYQLSPIAKRKKREYYEILNNTFSTEHLHTTASLVKVYRIISFTKIAVNRKDKSLTRKEHRHRYLT